MGGAGGTGRTIRTVAPRALPTGARRSNALIPAQQRQPYSRMRLTRTLEERLVHPGAMRVHRASPVEIRRQDMAPVTMNVPISFTLRGAERDGPAYAAAGATSTGAARWAARCYR